MNEDCYALLWYYLLWRLCNDLGEGIRDIASSFCANPPPGSSHPSHPGQRNPLPLQKSLETVF